VHDYSSNDLMYGYTIHALDIIDLGKT